MLGAVPGSLTCLAAPVDRNKSSARGAAPAGPPPAWHPCLAPQPHTEPTGCPARTQQCLPSLGSHSTKDDLYDGLLPAFSFVLFLFLLTFAAQVKVFLVVPLSPSLTAAAQFLLKLGESLPSTLATCMNEQFCKCHIFFLNGIGSSYIPRQPHLCTSFIDVVTIFRK